MQDNREIADRLRNALWMFDSTHKLGRQPGSFTTHLLRAMAHADRWNASRLAKGFPDLMWAVDTLQHHDHGYNRVSRRIRELEAGEEQ